MKRTLFAVLAVASVGAQAVSLYSTSFEEFTAGSNVFSSMAPWTGTTSAWTTQNGGGSRPAAFSGNNLLDAPARVGANLGRWAWVDVSSAWAARPSGQNVAVGSTMMYLPGTATQSVQYGLQMYDNVGGYVAGMMFDVANNLVIGDDGINVQVLGAGIARDRWVQMEMVADYDVDTITFRVDGVNIGGFAYGSALPDLGDFDLVNFAVNSTAVNTAYFDDFGVKAVPEPASMAALGAGALALIRRRRSK